MTLEEIQKEINQTKNELAKVPQIEARLHRLLGMEEILLIQEEESKKPNLKVASSDATG
tara:strand:+ start:1370 stop:1546 length:177 start_codon:yes stop_codon:yes gene_type:complete